MKIKMFCCEINCKIPPVINSWIFLIKLFHWGIMTSKCVSELSYYWLYLAHFWHQSLTCTNVFLLWTRSLGTNWWIPIKQVKLIRTEKKTFLSWRSVWNCHLQNVYFVQASTYLSPVVWTVRSVFRPPYNTDIMQPTTESGHAPSELRDLPLDYSYHIIACIIFRFLT